jgi:carboxyl-terminal processing protease
MVKRFAIYTFVRDYLAKNPPVDASFQVSDALLEEFKQHVTKRGIGFTEKEFQDNRDYLKKLIRYEVVYNRVGVSDAARVLLESDPLVLKGIELIPEARDLATRARRQLAERN